MTELRPLPITSDGEVAFTAPISGVAPTAAGHLATRGWTEDTIADHNDDADPHPGYQKESEKAAANGYAGLDAGSKVPAAQLPIGVDVLAQDALLDAASGVQADGDILYFDGGSWVLLAAGTAGQVLTIGVSGLPEWQTP